MYAGKGRTPEANGPYKPSRKGHKASEVRSKSNATNQDAISASTGITARTLETPREPMLATSNSQNKKRKTGHDEGSHLADDMEAPDQKRRNPKRKAADDMKQLPDNQESDSELLREALKPLTREEIRKWKGWCELESEPAFFNTILSEYGVRNVKMQEIFALEDAGLSALPQPILGLIFLYPCSDGPPEAEAGDDDTGDLWFANQTTDNACATLAMMNIIMNCPQVQFGPELQKFKDSTKSLSYPLRGKRLGDNEFIRSRHNSLARRIDFLNSDLWLHSHVAKFKKAKPRKTPVTKKQKKAPTKVPKKRKVSSDASFHYIAYVSANGSLWELDGLRPGPSNLGEIPINGNLVTSARPYLQARMEGHEWFNMMGLCQSPLAATSMQLAQTIVHLNLLLNRSKSDPKLMGLLQKRAQQPLVTDDDDKLQAYGLTKQSVEETVPDADFLMKVTAPDTSITELERMYGDLTEEQKIHFAAYQDENRSLADAAQLVNGRRQDNMSVIHRWLEAIAAHGKLEDLITASTADKTRDRNA